ncbi:MAG: acylphosphatase [Gemmatimonadota bacterium]
MPSNQHDRTCGFLVAGRVQGVGFRWWARHTASRLRLSGTVRNLPGGRVEVKVRGSSAAVDDFERHLWIGPPVASVRTVETFQVDEILPDGFRVVT